MNRKTLFIFFLILIIGVFMFVGCDFYDVERLENIRIISTPTNVQFVGKNLDLEGLKVVGIFNEDFETYEKQLTDYEVSPKKFETTGTNTVVVSYRNKTTSFSVNVVEEESPKTFEGLEILSTPTNKQYTNETLDTTGLVILGKYKIDGNEVKVVVSGYTLSPLTLTSETNQTITVSYTEGITTSTSFTVQVQERPYFLSSIKVLSSNSNLSYNDFDNVEFKTSDLDLVLEAEYSNGLDSYTTTMTDGFVLYSPTISNGTVVKNSNEEDKVVNRFTVYYSDTGLTTSTSFDFTMKVYNLNDYMMLGTTPTDLSKDWFSKLVGTSGTTKSQITSITFTTTTSLEGGVNLDVADRGFVKGYLSGTDIFIVGDKVVGNYDCSYLFGKTNFFNPQTAFSNLTQLDLSNFDTSKVVDMTSMFQDCSNLIKLDLSGFDTSNVTTMSSMFSVCGNLKELNVCSFDTSKVTDMQYMFNSCAVLPGLDLTSFNTGSVTTMEGMFTQCQKLSSVLISSKWVREVKQEPGKHAYMFSGCAMLSSEKQDEFFLDI